MAKISGTFYVTDNEGHDLDVSISESGEITLCVLGDGGVMALDYEGAQPLLDVLTFLRDMADKYGVSE